MAKDKAHILHLTPHAGGGVGTVLRALLGQQKKDFKISLCSMEYLNKQMKAWCEIKEIDFIEHGFYKKKTLTELMKKADIVHIHWWNHPLLHALLAWQSLPPLRTVLWSHVNGMHAPQLFFPELLEFPDLFVVATPQSYRSPLIQTYKNKWYNKISHIQSNAGIPRDAPCSLPDRRQCKMGYIGTVDYSKMHADFLSLWKRTGITDSPLVVCGGPADLVLRDQIDSQGADQLFDVRGIVSNIPEVLQDLSVLFYPLQSCHYGTGEQVLIEAMAFGVVPLVMAGGCEEFVVKHKHTGLVASNDDEFVKMACFLHSNKQERQRLAKNCLRETKKQFAIQETLSQWQELYSRLMEGKKTIQQLKLRTDLPYNLGSALSLMLTSYGSSPEGELFASLVTNDKVDESMILSPAMKSTTRGAPQHYHSFFPEDELLTRGCEKLDFFSTVREKQ